MNGAGPAGIMNARRWRGWRILTGIAIRWMQLLTATYGRDAAVWRRRWRLFFSGRCRIVRPMRGAMCGGVSHYRLRPGLKGLFSRIVGHNDPLVGAANLIALVIAWNAPLYPLYVWWVAGARRHAMGTTHRLLATVFRQYSARVAPFSVGSAGDAANGRHREYSLVFRHHGPGRGRGAFPASLRHDRRIAIPAKRKSADAGGDLSATFGAPAARRAITRCRRIFIPARNMTRCDP